MNLFSLVHPNLHVTVAATTVYWPVWGNCLGSRHCGSYCSGFLQACTPRMYGYISCFSSCSESEAKISDFSTRCAKRTGSGNDSVGCFCPAWDAGMQARTSTGALKLSLRWSCLSYWHVDSWQSFLGRTALDLKFPWLYEVPGSVMERLMLAWMLSLGDVFLSAKPFNTSEI